MPDRAKTVLSGALSIVALIGFLLAFGYSILYAWTGELPPPPDALVAQARFIFVANLLAGLIGGGCSNWIRPTAALFGPYSLCQRWSRRVFLSRPFLSGGGRRKYYRRRERIAATLDQYHRCRLCCDLLPRRAYSDYLLDH
jgi:hypothetical protein